MRNMVTSGKIRFQKNNAVMTMKPTRVLNQPSPPTNELPEDALNTNMTYVFVNREAAAKSTLE